MQVGMMLVTIAVLLRFKILPEPLLVAAAAVVGLLILPIAR